MLARQKHDPSVCGAQGCTAGKINDVFFEQQTGKGFQWPELMALPGFMQLHAQFIEAFKQYFVALGAKPPAIDPNHITASLRPQSHPQL